MGTPAILTATNGINVMSPDTKLKADEVRDAVNVILYKDGGFARRNGAAQLVALANPRSLWTSDYDHTYVAAGSNLYEVTVDGSLSTLRADLWSGNVAYADQGGATYASTGKLLRIDAHGARAAGVLSLLWFTPTLSTTTGGLDVGTYCIACSAVNALGEESGLCVETNITLTTPGAIVMTLPSETDEVDHWNLYRSPVNGGELYYAGRAPANATTATLNFGELGKSGANLWMREPLMSGQYLASHKGVLYSATGSFLFYTDPFSPLMDARSGFIPFPGPIRGVLPVDDGIYIGTDDFIYWLAGSNPKEFTLLAKQDSGMYPGSGALVSGDFFGQATVKMAVWLSPIGYQLGGPGGQLTTPQSTRMRIQGTTRAITTPVVLNGVKQLVSAVDTLTLGDGGSHTITP